MAAGDKTADLFRALSAVLIGEPAVAATTADRHLATLRRSLGDATVADVLGRFAELEAAGGDLAQAVGTLIQDPALGPTVKAMVLLWFTGQPDVSAGAPGPASQEDYAEALMWTAVGAHPPAFSNGYYGHWRYPPDTGR